MKAVSAVLLACLYREKPQRGTGVTARGHAVVLILPDLAGIVCRISTRQVVDALKIIK
jgi:hypothetical protein